MKDHNRLSYPEIIIQYLICNLSYTMNPKYYVILGIAIAVSLFLTSAAGTKLSLADNNSPANGANTQSAITTSDTTNAAAIHTVGAGDEGQVAPITKFMPTTVEIKQGETVTWHNPSKVA
jgi:hypothetical protein